MSHFNKKCGWVILKYMTLNFIRREMFWKAWPYLDISVSPSLSVCLVSGLVVRAVLTWWTVAKEDMVSASLTMVLAATVDLTVAHVKARTHTFYMHANTNAPLHSGCLHGDVNPNKPSIREVNLTFIESNLKWKQWNMSQTSVTSSWQSHKDFSYWRGASVFHIQHSLTRGYTDILYHNVPLGTNCCTLVQFLDTAQIDLLMENLYVF